MGFFQGLIGFRKIKRVCVVRIVRIAVNIGTYLGMCTTPPGAPRTTRRSFRVVRLRDV